MSDEARAVIAVVDDDPRILESLEELLESAGYQARLHASGSSLLAGGISDIDCLITDISMPVMDGLELRARVKQLRPDLPVFLISARRDLGQHAGVGAGEFFPKPFDGSTLLAAISKALRNASA
jgi:FixJ family two-component response regulator